MPAKIAPQWFREVAPIGLQIQLPGDPSIRLGLVSSRVQDSRQSGGEIEEVAYPFLFVMVEDQLDICFSSRGPASEIQREIATAFGTRLL